MHEYFEHSSTRRVVYFDVHIPSLSKTGPQTEIITIDGVGRLSHPIQLRARRQALQDFSSSDRVIIDQTRDGKKGVAAEDGETLSVVIIEDHDRIGADIEQWAVEYSSKFVHAAGPEFYATTTAIILGTAYVKKGLPEV